MSFSGEGVLSPPVCAGTGLAKSASVRVKTAERASARVCKFTQWLMMIGPAILNLDTMLHLPAILRCGMRVSILSSVQQGRQFGRMLHRLPAGVVHTQVGCRAFVPRGECCRP